MGAEVWGHAVAGEPPYRALLLAGHAGHRVLKPS